MKRLLVAAILSSGLSFVLGLALGVRRTDDELVRHIRIDDNLLARANWLLDNADAVRGEHAEQWERAIVEWKDRYLS